MIQVYNNFLPKDVFKKLKNAMMSNYFPWYFNEYVNYKGEKNDSFQFTFGILNLSNIFSSLFFGAASR